MDYGRGAINEIYIPNYSSNISLNNYNQNQNGLINRIKNQNVDYMQNINPVPRQDYVYYYNQVPNHYAPYQQNMNQHPIHIPPVYNRLASQNDQVIYENPIEYQNYNHYQVQNQDLNDIKNFNHNLNLNLLPETLDAVVKKMLEPYLFGNENPMYSPNKDVKLNDNTMPENKIAMNVHRWKHFDTIRNELNQKHK
jgi:hypothetical protein